MRHAGHIFGIAFITVLFLFVAYLESLLLDTNPPQLPEGVTIEQWMASFQMWAIFCVASAGVTSLLWYVLGQWVFNIDKWEGSGKRMLWVLLFIVPIITIIASCICVERTESSLMVVYVFFFFNGVLPYYFATLLFSPSAFKYTPALAKQIRFW